MAPVKNGRYIFNEVPTGYPVPGKTLVYEESEIDPDTVPLNGGFIVKILVLSVDPYLRGRMRDAKVESYLPAFDLGEPIYNFGIGLVVRSENPTFKSGDHLYGLFKFQHYVIDTAAEQYRVIKNKDNLPWSVYLGVCGMPGQTAEFGWKEYANPKQGEIAFVTAASGPVGATVVQLAKAEGLKVIASAGSDDKVDFVKSIGADVAFNYKTTDTREVLAKEGPVDVFWDNVGGATLDAALEFSAKQARFIECGMISQYNTTEPYPLKNHFKIFEHQVHLHGFLVGPLMHKYIDQFYATFPGRVARGEIKYKEHRVHGLEQAGKAIVDVQSGGNFGKSVLIVADH
ncbi:NAD(P)-binding protein [Trametes maxima]|nr:NAD(P)-binding protein [Trametes maxima]